MRLALPLTNYESNTVVISGINVGVPILIDSGGEAYSINGGAYRYTSGTVFAGDRVTLRDQLHPFEVSRTSTVKVGDYSTSWTITSLP